jgi:hypothetical protein
LPDGGTRIDLQYRPAHRGQSAILLMLAGPAGSGKTYSALRLGRGLAGPNGVICFADTERGRALFYADEFGFLHLDLREPFRPALFERAAEAAQRAGAVVWICDSFTHEHTGPGGVLDYHEEELRRLAGEDDAKRERVKMLAWVKPKVEHKHMLNRLWQLNCHVILCCQADRKTELVKIEEGRDRGKIKPVDRGYQPVCGGDIPYAMTASFLFSAAAPGVPVVIKPLLPALRPLIALDKPMDQATGAAIAAWASGEGNRPTAGAAGRKVVGEETSKKPQDEAAPPGGQSPAPNPAPSGPPEGPSGGQPEGPAPEAPPPPEGAEPPPTEPPPPASDEDGYGAPPEGGPTPGEPPTTDDPADDTADDTEARIMAKAESIAAMFRQTASRQDHLKIVDDPDIRGSFEWIKKHRRPVWLDVIEPAMRESWKRTDPSKAPTQQQGMKV